MTKGMADYSPEHLLAGCEDTDSHADSYAVQPRTAAYDYWIPIGKSQGTKPSRYLRRWILEGA